MSVRTILVDTSVWIDLLQGHDSPEAERLDGLLAAERDDIVTCGLIVTEIVQGLRRDAPELRARLESLRWLEPKGKRTWFAAAALYRGLRARGITVRSTIDCLIATLASEANAFLLAKDRDIRFILDSRLVVVRALPLVD